MSSRDGITQAVPFAAMDTPISTGWHRKWLLLMAALIWIYFLRYRLLGWFLSQFVTWGLRWKHPQLQACAQIQYITLRPLQLGLVEIRGGRETDWRIVCTRVAVETHVLAFFRSFVQKKLVAIAVDDLFVDLFRLDEELVRDIVQLRSPPATGMDKTSDRNPMGFMRFIDLRVRSISVNVDVFETRTRFRCVDLCVDIPDVFVPQNLLHLSISATSLFMASRLLQNQSSSQRDSTTIDSNGVSWELAQAKIVLDVRLTDQEVVGCTIGSTADEPTYVHIDTSYVEHWLIKKMDLIQRDLLPIPKWMWVVGASNGRSSRDPPLSPFTLRVVDFPVTFDVVHRAPGAAKVPLQITTQIHRLEYAKNASASSILEPQALVTSGTTRDSEGVRMNLECQSIDVRSGVDFSRKVVSTTSCQVQMQRDSLGQGRMQCDIDQLRLAVDPQLCEVLHSLVLFPDVIDDYEKATLHLMFEYVSKKLHQPPFKTRQKVPVQWNISVNIHEWALEAWLQPGDVSIKRSLEAGGKQTTVRCTLPPKQSGLEMKHQVDLMEVSVLVALQNAQIDSGCRVDDYSIEFETVSISTSKLLGAVSAPKSMDINLASSSVVVNGRGTDIEGDHLPGLVFKNMAFHQTELESEDTVQVGISLLATEADIATSHSRHDKTMHELCGVVDTLDQVRIMLTPPEPTGTESKIAKDSATKSLDANVSASSVRAHLTDVNGISSSVEFAINEMKIAYQKSAVGIANTITCAFVKISWESEPVMDVAGVRFGQTIESKSCVDLISDMDSESTVDITFSQMHLWLKPERRLLLFFLKLDELMNSNDNSCDGQSTAAQKKTQKQKITLSCAAMGIQVEGLDESHHNIRVGQVKVQANISKSSKMTDAVLRYLQLTRRHDSCRSRLADCIQVQTVGGTFSAESLEVESAGEKLLHIDDALINFATTDVSVFEQGESIMDQSGAHCIPSTFLIFDLSLMFRQFRVTISRSSKATAKRIMPVLQVALDSRSIPTSSTSEDDPSNWRLRYVGAFDCGIQSATVTIPFGKNVFTSSYQTQLDTCDRYMLLRANQLALQCRQFQKILLQFELLRVLVADHDAEDDIDDLGVVRSFTSDTTLPVQLLYLPRIKLDAAIHWKAMVLMPDSRLQQPFAVSFDLVLRSNPVSSHDQVPIAGEALCSLNWEYVFPVLVLLVTDEDDEHDQGDLNSTDSSAIDLECVAIQWNMSLDAVQFAWWDAMSQDDSAMLIVTRDLLSHGLAKLLTDTNANVATEPTWVLWEITVYLDLFRAYLLREAHVVDECITLACGALPFQCCLPSQFFIETTGTSYRATHVSCDIEAVPSDGAGMLFGDLAFAVADRMHEQFTRIDYDFTQDHALKDPSTVSASNTSPPKSPRTWTQSVRAKLSRLKRRTSSMDNMFLNDGSRPIQVDSMKLLWTIETRDCAFNMIAVIGDSMEAITEVSRQRREHVRNASVRPLDMAGTPRRKDTDIGDRFSTTRCVDNSDTPRMGRRVSTRDSLLELLHQGKLGKSDHSTIKSDANSQQSPSGEKTRVDSEDTHLSKTIKNKKYTVDVHDVQINILEETTRSSALIASKRIHLEAGYDESDTTAIVTLKFECVTGHVAPLDVEVSNGVTWYTQGRGAMFGTGPYRTASSSSSLLKQVMEEFTLSAVYSQGIVTDDTSVSVDMSSLEVSTDRHQFYQLLNVLRHVLLAPPTIVLRVKRQVTNRRDHPSELSSEDTTGGTSSMPSTPLAVHAGKKLHAQLVEELRIRDSKMLGMNRSGHVLLKLISFRLAGCVFRLRASPESTGGDHEFVEIRAEGITGSHSFYANQNTKLVVNLLWMEINNLRPGPSSIAFEDAMAVLKAKLLVEQRYQSSKHVTLTNQKGMLTVRAESGPQTRVLGQKLRILDVLEISIFPEIPNMIVIQLAADFYELLYKFFFEQVGTTEHQETHNGEQLLFGKKGSSMAMNSSHVVPPSSPVTKPRAYTSPASPAPTRRKSLQSSSVTSVGSESALTISTAETSADDDDSSADGCELFYFKYVRIGNVRLRINCHGFFVNLSNFDLDLPPFVCQSKLCTWKKLLQKFESHLRWYITKESASTGLSHFKNKLLKWTPTASSGSEKKEKKKEDSTALNAQVLFGPYSGTQ